MGRIIKLQIPPGVYRNGTEYESMGRWHDVNLVRWRKGIQPVRGWRGWVSGANKAAADPTQDPVHGAMAWADNSGTKYVIFGYSSGVQVLELADGTVSSITPVGHAQTSTWGGGGDPPSVEADMWTFSAFGEIPLGCSSGDGRIWEWDLNTSNAMTQVTNSPTGCIGVHVTPERFVWALGDGSSGRSIRWSDREDRTVWTPAATNQAGGYDLDTEGVIRFAANVRGETIIVTTNDVWSAQYVGYPDVYVFRRLGDATCIGNMAGATAQDALYFMGDGKFHVVRGGYVETLPCDVEDFVFTDMETPRRHRVFAWHNEEFHEIWWHYLKDGGGSQDPLDRYVSYNYQTGAFSLGVHELSAVVPRGVWRFPIGFTTGLSTSIVTNGTFATDTDWTKGTNWQITGGAASQTSPTASNIRQTLSTQIADYTVVVNISGRTVGQITVGLTGGSFVTTDNGTVRGTIRPNTTTPIISITADGTWDGQINSAEVYRSKIVELEVPFDEATLGGVYQHGTMPYAETGPLEVVPGERRVHVTRVYPDEQDAGELSLTFKHREYPTSAETSETAVTAANPTDVRFSGRQFSMRVEPVTDNTDWRSGVHRLEITEGGRR